MTARSGAPLVAVGGLGGSGTRLVAAALGDCGIRIGTDLNEALDNLWFTLLFKQESLPTWTAGEVNRRLDLLADRMNGALRVDRELERFIGGLVDTREQHGTAWLRERALSFVDGSDGPPPPGVPWGWKEPNTHLVAATILQRWPTTRYVHVTRHGIEMAYSSNHNQARLWGPSVLGSAYEATPRYQLRYWAEATRRALALEHDWPGRVLLVDYDDWCDDPAGGLRRLARFLGRPLRTDIVHRSEPTRPPAPRRPDDARAELDLADVEFARSLGHLIERV